MSSASGGSFVAVMVAVALAPGPDVLVTMRSAMTWGSRAGLRTVGGILAASLLQGVAVAVGLGAALVRMHAAFTVLRWVGACYLVFLGLTALVAARRGPSGSDPAPERERRSRPGAAFRVGFLSNATNPKVFAFMLAFLPQFVSPDASVVSWLVHAWALPVIGSLWLAFVVLLVHRARAVLLRRTVRRVLDGISGTVLVGLGLRLAVQAG